MTEMVPGEDTKWRIMGGYSIHEGSGFQQGEGYKKRTFLASGCESNNLTLGLGGAERRLQGRTTGYLQSLGVVPYNRDRALLATDGEKGYKALFV